MAANGGREEDWSPFIAQLRVHVTALATAPSFAHSKWYVPYHLEPVVQISELFAREYPDVDVALIQAICWMHDYGQICGLAESDDANVKEIVAVLRGIGFDSEFIAAVVDCLSDFRRSEQVDLRTTRMETQIVSSADGCSHLVGPFMFLYWYENAQMSIDEIVAENRRKINYDWERKVVLPEARAGFLEQHEAMLVLVNGGLPRDLR